MAVNVNANTPNLKLYLQKLAEYISGLHFIKKIILLFVVILFFFMIDYYILSTISSIIIELQTHSSQYNGIKILFLDVFVKIVALLSIAIIMFVLLFL